MAARSSQVLARMHNIARVRTTATVHTIATRSEPEQLPLHMPIDEERAPGYNAKHFYHASPGEILAKRFKLVAKVGYGSTSTVWLAHTIPRFSKKQFVAIKIKTCDSGEDAEHETEISEIVKRAGTAEDLKQIATIDESFEIHGPHGKHACLVMEPLRDPLWLIRSRIDGPKATHEHLQFYKLYIKALLLGLDYLHSKCHVIHTDLKIDNVMLCFEGREVIEDFADAQLKHPMAQKTYEDHVVYRSHHDFGTPREIDGIPPILLMAPRITDFGQAQRGNTNDPRVHPIQPDHCHAPEVILGLTWSYSADIWNFGVMVYDLLEGQQLFSHIRDAAGIYSAKHHLAEMTKVLGPIPPDMLDKVLNTGNKWAWEPPIRNHHGEMSTTSNQYFGGPFYDSHGQLIHTHLDPPPPQQKSWESTLPECIQDEKSDYTDFMKKMLCWSPEKRSTAKELFDHPWLDISL